MRGKFALPVSKTGSNPVDWEQEGKAELRTVVEMIMKEADTNGDIKPTVECEAACRMPSRPLYWGN